MSDDLLDLPVLERITFVDVTTDKTHVLIGGDLENDTSIRLPISVQNAMRLWAMLGQIKNDFGFDVPSGEVEIDRLQ